MLDLLQFCSADPPTKAGIKVWVFRYRAEDAVEVERIAVGCSPTRTATRMCLALGPGSDSSYAAPTGGLSGGRGSTVLSCSPIARIGPFRVCSGRVTCLRGPATDAPRRPSHPWARDPPARRRCAGFGTQSVHETLVPLECRTFRHQNVIHGWPLLPLARSPSRRALDQLAWPELIMSAGGRSVDGLVTNLRWPGTSHCRLFQANRRARRKRTFSFSCPPGSLTRKSPHSRS